MKNNIKILFRHLTRYRTFSIINITGLAIGIATSLLIAIWVFDELSYDRFHEHADNIYRVERDMVFKGERNIIPVTTLLYGGTLEEQYPEIIDHVVVDNISTSLIDKRGNQHSEVPIFASESFFNVFTFPLEKGSKDKALSEVNSIVLTREAAKKYFGNEDPMGKNIKMLWDSRQISLKVTGILEKVPKNKHFDFDVLISYSTREALRPGFSPNWMNNSLYTYILVKDGTDMGTLQKKVQKIVEEHILPAYIAYFGVKELDGSFELLLRPVTDIHLHTNVVFDIQPQGDIVTVYIFIVIAILILLIAGLNFMNLSTALAGTRSLEVGVRKSLGATKKELVWQFMKESFIITAIAFVVAIAIIELFMPTFNNLVDKELSLKILILSPGKLLVLLGIIIFIAILSGLYPAFFLSSFKPIKVLRDKYQSQSKKFSLRQLLVVIQFTISIGLIIATLVIYRQITFFQDKPLGFTKDNVLVIPAESGNIEEKFETFKQELLQNKHIKEVASSSRVPMERVYSDVGWQNSMKKEKELAHFFRIGFDFLELYNLEMVAGRGFKKQHPTDTLNKVIISETVAKNMGYSNYKDAIGDKFHSDMLFVDSTEHKGKILGVFKDFHFQSLKSNMRPLALFIDEDAVYRISIQFDESYQQEVLGFVKNKWEEFYPGTQFNYAFMEERINANYMDEKRMKDIILGFTILAIFIACLGLYGLAAFVARKKTKEIGIRKVFGANVGNIVYILTKTFSKWVLLANIIAWPLAYYYMNKWLDNFAYAIQLKLWMFIGAALLALAIALLTITYHSRKAARANPVDAIRYE